MKKFEIKVTSNGETFTKEIEAEDGVFALFDFHWWVYFKTADLNNFTIEVKEI